MRKSELIKENKKFKKELDFYKPAYEALLEEYDNVMPPISECRRGDYCKICMFDKTITVPEHGVNTYFSRDVHYCNYGNICEHFVSKEVMNNEV